LKKKSILERTLPDKGGFLKGGGARVLTLLSKEGRSLKEAKGGVSKE